MQTPGLDVNVMVGLLATSTVNPEAALEQPEPLDEGWSWHDARLIGVEREAENGDGTRDSISKWNDPTDNSYQNTAGFGLLQFVK